MVYILDSAHRVEMCTCSGAMAALRGVIVIILGLLLPATAEDIVTEPTQWGKLRPARVLDINDTIYVHVVPHTHDDVGWLETVDEYYYGGIFCGGCTLI